MKWLAALSILLLLLLLFAYAIYQTNIFILLRYQRRDDNDNVFIRVYAWRGLLSYIIRVPVVQVDWRDEMLWFESELKETKGNRRVNTVFERQLIKKIIDFICLHPRRFRRIIENIQTKISQTKIIIRELHAKVRCDRLNCQVCLGVEDAATTAIAAGSFWLLKSFVVSALSTRMSIGVSPVCTITPSFGQNIVVIDIECILRIRLGNIIYALYNADKQGGKNRG